MHQIAFVNSQFPFSIKAITLAIAIPKATLKLLEKFICKNCYWVTQDFLKYLRYIN